jgi:hypothetical protein
MKEEKEDQKKLLCPKAGTATSTPDVKTSSPNIINVMLWMKRNAYADSTIKATAKRLKHLQKHCNLTQPEEVKTFIANKNCTNAFKECLRAIKHFQSYFTLSAVTASSTNIFSSPVFTHLNKSLYLGQ